MPEEVMPTAHWICDVSTALDLSDRQAEDFLGACLLGLLDAAVDNIRRLPNESSESTGKRGSMSYNLLILPGYMMLVPRSKSDHVFGQQEDGSDDKLSLNALGFAGMVLCKKERHVAAVQEVGVRQVCHRLMLFA